MKAILLLTFFTLFTQANLSSQNLYENALKISSIIEHDLCDNLDIILEKMLGDKGAETFKSFLLIEQNINTHKRTSFVKTKLDTLSTKLDDVIKIISDINKRIEELNTENKELPNALYLKQQFDLKEEKKLAENYQLQIERQINSIKTQLINSTYEIQSLKTEANWMDFMSGFNTVLSPTIMIDNTAQFLVDRSKKEINLAFLERYKSAINSNKYMQTLFPSVAKIILNNDLLNYSTWGTQLQFAAEIDLKNLPLNFSILLYSDPFNSLTGEQKELFETYLVIIQALNLQNSGLAPQKVISLLSELNGFPKKNNEISKIISLLANLSSSIQLDNSNNYVDPDSLVAMTSLERKVFLSLFAVKNSSLLQEMKLKSKVEDNLYTLISNDEANDIIGYLARMSGLYSNIKQSLHELNEGETQSNKVNTYKNINNYLVNSIELCYLISNISNTSALTDETGYYLKVKPTLTNTVLLVNNLLDENYTAAFVSFNNLVIPLLNGLIDIKAEVDPTKCVQWKANLERVVFWGGFLAEIAVSDTVVEVKDLLEKYAEPAGSFRIKRGSQFSISINSFPGVFGGIDIITDNHGKLGTGFVAPIGINFSRANRTKIKVSEIKNASDFDFYKNSKFNKYTGSCTNFFISIIDIGAPFIYRWSNDFTQGFTDQIKWEDVFAPGISIGHGFAKSGLTLMVTGQIAPALQKVTEIENFIAPNKTYRLGLTLTYDLPILTLLKR